MSSVVEFPMLDFYSNNVLMGCGSPMLDFYSIVINVVRSRQSSMKNCLSFLDSPSITLIHIHCPSDQSLTTCITAWTSRWVEIFFLANHDMVYVLSKWNHFACSLLPMIGQLVFHAVCICPEIFVLFWLNNNRIWNVLPN
jgi:hypothetical protein